MKSDFDFAPTFPSNFPHKLAINYKLPIFLLYGPDDDPISSVPILDIDNILQQQILVFLAVHESIVMMSDYDVGGGGDSLQ